MLLHSIILQFNNNVKSDVFAVTHPRTNLELQQVL